MIITICGSMNKYKLMSNISSKLMSSIEDLQIFIPETYNPILFGGKKLDPDPIELRNLYKLHKLKIDLADIILIIDYGAGQGTHEELEYAESMNKPIIRLSEIIKYFKDDESIMKEIKGDK